MFHFLVTLIAHTLVKLRCVSDILNNLASIDICTYSNIDIVAFMLTCPFLYPVVIPYSFFDISHCRY
jgi:hypothetical protein